VNREGVSKGALLLLTFLISALFLSMVRQFLVTLLLAGIFSALAQPLFRLLERRFGGRRNLASIVTVFFVLFVILLPLLFLTGIVTAQAIKVSDSVTPWIQKYLSEPESFTRFLDSLPFVDRIKPYLDTIVQKTGELVAGGSQFLINRLSSAAGATVLVLFQTFIFFYVMFFFLKDGHVLLEKIMYYLPLDDADERLLLKRFTSVTRATLKGTLVIGFLQGTLAGAAFWAVGITSAAFWGTVMIVLSIIPGIGTALIWVPAAAVLALEGDYGRAAGLTLFCAVVVGSIDNVLRPRLVGRDTKMHDLLVFFGTIGGLALFGIVGFMIGPVVAALFVTVWEMYGVAFRELLPEVGIRSPRAEESGDEEERTSE